MSNAPTPCPCFSEACTEREDFRYNHPQPKHHWRSGLSNDDSQRDRARVGDHGGAIEQGQFDRVRRLKDVRPLLQLRAADGDRPVRAALIPRPQPLPEFF